MRRGRAWSALTLALVACAVAVALAARIWVVNARAPVIPEEWFQANEDVPLEGAFAEYRYENTRGYSICVTDARSMSVREYLAEFSKDDDAARVQMERLAQEGTDLDAKTLLVADITMKNEKGAEDERGYLDSIGWSVKCPETPAYWIRVQSMLFSCSVPQINGSYKLSIRPKTEYVIHVPFASTMFEATFPQPYDYQYLPTLEPGEYGFVVTKGPVRKVVHLDVA
ncbi:hypothetical protein HMPREF1008_00341 [Olsenella sp. oral taxon 809 str. F0356]|uniref:hypothetical protein n=1 Tax=Olsenella sp. oral taxon 809 TaxID=661086 RepID=UPI000231EFDF|nr:hypothetical protein [Olsenella sp. oral taxon 809]EHF02696.1 hypothetical protein HMPREF1008_00341 [Olsenella sp. oral taxon 809 str. F0356]